MAGDHACPVCGARFTRPQHVTRHMRSHTGDRPYKCTQCGDQFARSDLLSRHVNKCHSGTPATVAARANKRGNHATTATTATTFPNVTASVSASVPCDQCLQLRQHCDFGAPCGRCNLLKSQCSNIIKVNRDAISASGRRGSLPNLGHPHQSLPYGSQIPGGPFQYGPEPVTIGSQPFVLGQYGTDYGAAIERSLHMPSHGAQPVPMPNGQFIGGDPYSILTGPHRQGGELSGQNGYGLPSSRLANTQLPQATQYNARANHQQRYSMGDELANVLPPLSFNVQGGVPVPGSSDHATAYLQQRRGSLNLPSQNRVFSDGYQLAPLQSQLPQASSSLDVGAGHLGRQGQPQFGSPQQSHHPRGSPSSSFSRQFDGVRVNERLSSIRGPGSSNEDASSVSDFGSNSGHPSPVPSGQSLFSSHYAASSRPTSSAGSLAGSSGFDAQNQASTATASDFTSLQSAVPLPTPLQINSFNSFPGGNTTSNDRTPGPVGDAKAGLYPPYQSFDNMNLEEAASFAAAAKNASGSTVDNNNYSGWQATQPSVSALGPPTLSHASILSAGGRERANYDLNKFWENFISEPLTGGATGVRTDNSGGSSGSGRSLSKQQSLPSLKTPLSSERSSILNLEMNHPTPRVLYPNGAHQSILGMSLKKEGQNDAVAKPSEANTINPAGTDNPENLRSYQEACLKRETPLLKLQPRPKSRTVGSSMSPQSIPDTTLPNVSDVDHRGPVFATPFAPGSKEARDWSHFRAQAQASTDLHQSTRPNYKRLPSQTLGPENSKRHRDGEADDDADASDPEDGHQLGSTRPGFATTNANGSHAGWIRQRSASSPTSIRPNFEWQSLAATGVAP